MAWPVYDDSFIPKRSPKKELHKYKTVTMPSTRSTRAANAARQPPLKEQNDPIRSRPSRRRKPTKRQEAWVLEKSASARKKSKILHTSTAENTILNSPASLYNGVAPKRPTPRKLQQTPSKLGSKATKSRSDAAVVSGNKNADNTKDDGSAHKSGGTGANTNNDINANNTISYSM